IRPGGCPGRGETSGGGTVLMEERRILLVDDNEVNRVVASRLLQRLGFTVDSVADGLAALEAHAAATYDAILMDCQMPTLDGYECTRRIRAREGTSRHTPIVALTANADVEDRRRCLAAGMDDYLTKPIEADRLVQSLRRFMPN